MPENLKGNFFNSQCSISYLLHQIPYFVAVHFFDLVLCYTARCYGVGADTCIAFTLCCAAVRNVTVSMHIHMLMVVEHHIDVTKLDSYHSLIVDHVSSWLLIEPHYVNVTKVLYLAMVFLTYMQLNNRNKLTCKAIVSVQCLLIFQFHV